MNALSVDEILKDEKILWSGSPDPNIFLRAEDAFLIPFSILWCGFVVFWEYKVLTLASDPSDSVVRTVFMIFGVPFIIVGFYLLIGRFFWRRFKNSRTSYFVTNKRVIIIKNVFNKNVLAQFIDRIPCINKEERGNGYGTIRFGNSLRSYVAVGTDLMDMWGVGAESDVPVFYDIKDVKKVYDIVTNIRKE